MSPDAYRPHALQAISSLRSAPGKCCLPLLKFSVVFKQKCTLVIVRFFPEKYREFSCRVWEGMKWGMIKWPLCVFSDESFVRYG